MKKILLAVILLTIALTSKADFIFSVKLRENAMGSILVNVLENPNAPNGRRVLFIPGLVHAGNAWNPLIREVYYNSTLGPQIRDYIVLNFPGRGGSGVKGMLLGDLSLEDYSLILAETLKQCSIRGIPPTEIVAHSMGGLVVQLLQENLLSINSNLKKSFGISKVRVVGSSSPKEVLDPLLEEGTGLFLLSLFTIDTGASGLMVSIPVDDPSGLSFRGLFFTDYNQQFVLGTPTPQEVVNLGYKSSEPYIAASQTVGTADMRPHVRAKCFSPVQGTNLRVIIGSEDWLSDPNQQKKLYEYLTGDLTDSGLIWINAHNAVHDQMIANPKSLFPLLDL